MSDRDQNRRANEQLQGAEGEAKVGDDERQFGAGGQRTQTPLSGNDAPDRDPARDQSLPPNQTPTSNEGDDQ